MKRMVTLAMAVLLACCLVTLPAQAETYDRLTWVQGTAADAPTDAAEVGEALNAISREKLGVEVDILYLTNEQVLTSIQSGEVHDMYFTCDWYNDYVTQAYAGIYADITGLVETVTPALYATMPEEVWSLAKVDGKQYGIPVKKDYYPEVYLIFDRDLFADMGMEIPAEMDFVELEPFLSAQKEANPDRYPMMMTKVPSGIDGIFNYINRQALIGFPYAAAGTEDATRIISIFEDADMVARFKALYDWAQKGYINPDAATIGEEGLDTKVNYVKVAQGFYGVEVIWSSQYQYPVAISKISGPYLSASGVRGSLNAFSSALEADPERLALALQYQELVNTDQAYRDILRYGLEGIHFDYNADGTVTKTDAGVNNYSPWAFSQGSYALSSVEASTFPGVVADPHMWDVVFEGYEDAIVAADRGFSFDPTAVEMEVAQLTVIKDKWFGQIFTGTVDPDTAIPQILAEMEAAGLRDVISEAQAQLDIHLATQQ